MTIVLDSLRYLAYILIFPGFLFCFLTGMLLCGIDRKLVARMQKRIGPPVLQPFYDFFKLLGKETIVPAAANRVVFLAAPLVGLAAQVVLQLFIPVFSFSAFRGVADVIVPLVLVLLAVATTVGNAMGTGLCFSLSQIAEYQAANGSLITRLSMLPAVAAMLLIIPGETGNHPFDAAEAETEICEGMLAEYSGAPLAVYKLSHAVKLLTMTSLFVALFLGGIGGAVEHLLVGLAPAIAGGLAIVIEIIILFLLCIVLVALCCSLVHAVTARLRIEQLFKYYWTVVAGLALISVVLAWYGL